MEGLSLKEKTEETNKENIITERKLLLLNIESETETEEEASIPRNKVDQNSSKPVSHYVLCQLC